MTFGEEQQLTAQALHLEVTLFTLNCWGQATVLQIITDN